MGSMECSRFLTDSKKYSDMKDIKYMLLALVCVLFSSCMGEDYAAPTVDVSPYGNNEITDTNVLTIAQLKTKYSSVISSSGMAEITDDIKIKGLITGNDIQGNIYNEVSIQDSTGAFLISIAAGGLYGSLPVGQKIIVDLKGLYVGGYGMQGEIGMPYTSSTSGSTYVSRMSRFVWDQHYKAVGSISATTVPEIFNVSKVKDDAYMAANCGKLMKIKSVVLKAADGKAVYAPNDGSVTLTSNCANREINGISPSSLVLRTSTYADFANAVMPAGEVDITGIFTRYRNTWQILMRSSDDIKTANPFEGVGGTGLGTADSPFNVARALSLVSMGQNDSGTDVYIKGVISAVKSVDISKYGNAEYYISDDGKTTNQLQVFRGFYLDGAKFTSADQIKVGQKVTILGKLTSYNNAAEVNTGSKIISIK